MVQRANHDHEHSYACYCLPMWQRVLLRIFEYLMIFLIGGAVYVCMEILWRGYSHWTMFIVGGLCLLIVGALNECVYGSHWGIVKQALLGAVVITLIEFAVGIVVNVLLNWNVWDYSDVPFNILGQVCIPYMVMWFALSFVAIYVDDLIRHKFFDGPKPKYTIW